jgi:mono/diheme cytochrome c family protein
LTEIPEHLLKRSKAAKSGKSGDAGGDAAPAESGSTPVAAEAAAPAPAPAADLPNLDSPPPPPKPVPAYVQAALSRRRIPVWVLPVIVALPVWALSYAGTMQQPETEDILLVDGAAVYGSCSGCHGGAGGGGVGYPLSDGEVLQTFPDPIDQMAHVARGSDAIAGQEYGAARADGSRRVAGGRGRGPMPAQLSTLSQAELEAVIFHERAILSGEDTASPAYQEWMDHIREALEGPNAEDPIDLDFLLACANPDITPGATGEGSDDPENRPCPGPAPEEDGAEQAAG